MSQRDLVAELRAAHVEAPPEVRERVRLIAAAAPGTAASHHVAPRARRRRAGRCRDRGDDRLHTPREAATGRARN